MTGWGTTSAGGSIANTLRKVDVPVVSDDDCRDSYGQSSIYDSMICAGLDAGGKDSCQVIFMRFLLNFLKFQITLIKHELDINRNPFKTRNTTISSTFLIRLRYQGSGIKLNLNSSFFRIMVDCLSTF